MAGTYGITETQGSELSQLIASDIHIQREITIKASAGAMSRGTVLEMVRADAGTWQKLATAANARAILLEDVANSASTQKAQAYFVGKYREKDLIWYDDITTLEKRTAIVALQDIARMGLHVPRSVSVMGVDNIRMAGLSNPPLTTVAQPIAAKGSLAVELLLERIEQAELSPRRKILQTQVVERASTGPPPA